MREAGRLLASGRDADIFECGPGLVLRRARQARSLAAEAKIMSYLYDQGFPVPAIEEISEDGLDLVMQRVDGPSMAEAMTRRPWALGRYAALLAELHLRLHDIRAPAYARAADIGQGDRVVHQDLHPLNVIIGPRGPVVIDWARGGRGDPNVDVAIAWLLLATAMPPAGPVELAFVRLARRIPTRAFLRHFDRAAIAPLLPEIVEWKASDPNMSAVEIAAMRRLAAAQASAGG